MTLSATNTRIEWVPIRVLNESQYEYWMSHNTSIEWVPIRVLNESQCESWLVQMCDMTRWYVWHDSFICVTWLVHMCDMTRSYVWHDSWNDFDSFNIRLLLSSSAICVWHDQYEYQMSPNTSITWVSIRVLNKSQYESLSCNWFETRIDSALTATGWSRLIGSPKLQIIFHKRATTYRSLLRKMTH